MAIVEFRLQIPHMALKHCLVTTLTNLLASRQTLSQRLSSPCETIQTVLLIAFLPWMEWASLQVHLKVHSYTNSLALMR